MHLTARSPSCFSSRYLLSLDARPIGEFARLGWSSGFDVRLVGGRRLELRRRGWFSTTFDLFDRRTGEAIATATHRGVFSSAWDMTLGLGGCELVSAGLFNTGFELRAGGRRLAAVDRLGFCEGGWQVHNYAPMADHEMMMVGLIYHVILSRRRQRHSSGAAAGAH